MRRIEFIAPVEAMRGNLSGSQRLTYPTQNNRAWDSPSNKRNYSTNYSSRYIGSKRAMNGKKFFSVKTKTAVTMSPKMREQQAVLSVGSVMANLIMADLRTLVRLQELFKISPEISQGWSFKRWISVYTRNGLKNKKHIVFPTTGSQAAIIFVNPYITAAAPSQAYDVNDHFPAELIYKFALQLGDANLTKNTVTFDGAKYEMFNMAGQTWAANRTAESGLVIGKPIGYIFLNGRIAPNVTSGGFVIPSGGGQIKFIPGPEYMTGVPVYTTEEGEEVAVETTDEVIASGDYIAHN